MVLTSLSYNRFTLGDYVGVETLLLESRDAKCESQD